MKAKIKIISCEVFPFDVMVCFSPSPKPIFKELKKHWKKEQVDEAKEAFGLSDRMTSARTAMNPGGQVILWMDSKPDTPHKHGTLAHEIFHAACFILDRVDIKFSMDHSDEAFAYLIGFITKRIYEDFELAK